MNAPTPSGWALLGTLLDARLFQRWLPGLASVEDDQEVHEVLDEVQALLLRRSYPVVGDNSRAAVGASAQATASSNAVALGDGPAVRLGELLAAERALVAAVGHSNDDVRDRAVVLLNVLYDGHPLQLAGDPLPPVVQTVGQSPTVCIPFNSEEDCQAFDVDSALVYLFMPAADDGPGTADAPPASTAADGPASHRSDRRGFVNGPPSSTRAKSSWSARDASERGTSTAAASSPPPTPRAERGVPPGCRALWRASRGHWQCHRITVHDQCLIVHLPQFALPGFYDWFVGPPHTDSNADARLTHPLTYADVPGMDFRRLRGRFIVQPQDCRSHRLYELPVDQVSAEWDPETGALLSRGSFDHVRELLPQLAAAGITGVYLSGCLERRLDEKEPTPHTVVDRAAPATILGGAARFRRLCAEARQHHLAVIVDSMDRVSLARSHRRYARSGYVRLVDAKRQVPALPHPGTDCHEVQWEDTALPNYRRVETWYSLVDDVTAMAVQYGARGVRLDNAQCAPCILQPDVEELNRMDNDRQPHYSPEERAFGDVVRPNAEGGYWNTDAAADGYANPLLAKLARELWATDAAFVLIGESHFHRERSLIVSGFLPHTMRTAALLAGISGKSLRRDGSVRALGQGRYLTADVLARLYRNDLHAIPNGAIMVSGTCTDTSPYPSVLYGRRAWLAVDLLFFLPELPMLLLGEEDGRAMRINMATVSGEVDVETNLDLELPKSPRLRTSGMHRGASVATGMSLLSLQQSHTADVKKLKRAGSREAGLSKLSEVGLLATRHTALKPPAGAAAGTAAGTAMMRSRSTDDMLKVSIRSVSVEDLRQLVQAEEDTRRSLGPDQGYDIHLIRGHYDHRRRLRNQYVALREGSMVVLTVRGHAKWQAFAFARFTAEQVLLVFMNVRGAADGGAFGAPLSLQVDLRPLAEALALSDRRNGRIGFGAWDRLVRIRNVFSGEATHEVFALEELLFRPFSLMLQPLETCLLEVVREPLPPTAESDSLLRTHRRMSASRLVADDETLQDPRANWYAGRLARRCSTLTDFAPALLQLYEDLVSTAGVASPAARYLTRLCLQRSSMLDGENEYPPQGFAAVCGERLIAYLMHMSTAGRPAVRDLARAALSGNRMGPIVLFSPELGRFSTAGGLGTMIDELSKGLADLGLEVYVVTPYYTFNRKGEMRYLEGDGIRWSRNVDVRIGNVGVATLGVFEGRENGVNLIFFENHTYFPRVYQDLGSQARAMEMLVVADRGVLEICCHKQLRPSLLVTNDWMGGLVPAYGRLGYFGGYFDDTCFFHIVHNLGDSAYEGRLYPGPHEGAFEYIHHLPRDVLVDPMWDGVVVNPSRAAFKCAHSWGTVSRSYLEELLSLHPLRGVMQICRAPFGTSNGIRVADRLAFLQRVAGSHDEAKAALQSRYFGLVDASIPVFAFVGRLTSQKGVHLILSAVPTLMNLPSGGKCQVLIGGMANRADPYGADCARRCDEFRARYAGHFYAEPDAFFTNGPLANLGADFCLMPSVFEPGGIVQQEFFVAGTPVVAFRTGGLRDTVIEWDPVELTGSGFVFSEYTLDDFLAACKRALRVYAKSDEYHLLRESARACTIDVAQVAFAWSLEFHRVKNIVPAKDELLAAELEQLRAQTSTVMTTMAAAELFEATQAVRVSWPDANAKAVSVKGSFDGWNREWLLQKEDEGSGVERWGVTLQLPAGTYHLKFKVDGEWLVGKHLPTSDDGGIVNNIVRVDALEREEE